MKLYSMYFRTPVKEYNPDRLVAIKRIPRGVDPRVNLSAEGYLTVMEPDIKKYWEYGGGVEKLIYVGDVDDALLNPVLAEPDFVDEQIKSKKNGALIGYQG